MRIVNTKNIEIRNPDLSRGYLKADRIFVAHHKPIEHVEEQWHYEVIRVYPNGGKDIEKVIDVPGVEARDAWDEYEDVERYIEYTEEELLEINKSQNTPTFEERLQAVEAMLRLLIDKGESH